MTKEHPMPRPASSVRLREDIDHGEEDSETDAPEPAQASPDTAAPSAAGGVEDIHHDTELPPLRTASKRKGKGGIITLIIIAILGMAIGFAVVMLV
jgi:hypothetical protein